MSLHIFLLTCRNCWGANKLLVHQRNAQLVQTDYNIAKKSYKISTCHQTVITKNGRSETEKAQLKLFIGWLWCYNLSVTQYACSMTYSVVVKLHCTIYKELQFVFTASVLRCIFIVIKGTIQRKNILLLGKWAFCWNQIYNALTKFIELHQRK